MSRLTQGLLAACVLVLILTAFVSPWRADGEFPGADALAKAYIEETHVDYQPWFSSVVELSGEMEGFLFASQAALGAGLLGYYLGLLHRRRRPDREELYAARHREGGL
ncbi:energy-coupling factor ABC transporter substrate-binding protein [Symbiobacterium terraclitae]|uniref:energy-coupling factor ABC transporter substrate-binding protein n=1 Tax=Symbiobacterium terraclitae TaxID=557451 RepID=UPI0035B52518